MDEVKKLDIAYIENTCMEIISNAGEGRAHVYEALEFCLKEEYEKAKTVLDDADVYLQKAHDAQFIKLMKAQVEGNELPFHVIILHAMDLLMVATAERDMLKRIILSKIPGGK